MSSCTLSRYSLLNIPLEISSLVWEYLMPYDLCLCMTLCRALNDYLKSDQFWKHHTFRIAEYAYDNSFGVSPGPNNYAVDIHLSDLYTTPWSDNLSYFERYKRILESAGHRYIIYDIGTGRLITPERAFDFMAHVDVYKNISICPDVCIHSVYHHLVYSKVSTKNHPRSLCNHGIGSISQLYTVPSNFIRKYNLRFKRISVLVSGISDAIRLIDTYNESIKNTHSTTIEDIQDNVISKYRFTAKIPWKCLTCDLVHGPGSYLYSTHYRLTRCYICYKDTEETEILSFYSCKGCKKFGSIEMQSNIKLTSEPCGYCRTQLDRILKTSDYR